MMMTKSKINDEIFSYFVSVNHKNYKSMMQIALSELVLESRFGPIKLGTSLTDITKLLGEPDDSSRGKPPKILKYGQFQVTIFEQKVVGASLFCHSVLNNCPFSLHKTDIQLLQNDVTAWAQFLHEIGAEIEPIAALSHDNKLAWQILGQQTTLHFLHSQLDSIGVYAW